MGASSILVRLFFGLSNGLRSRAACAPLTHDHHKHHHNPKHKTVPAEGDRFHTTRDGAALDLPTEDDSFTVTCAFIVCTSTGYEKGQILSTTIMVGVLRSVGRKWGRVQGAKYSDEFLNRMHLAG